MEQRDPFAAALNLLDPPVDPYINDPAGWVGAKTGGHLWSKQVEIAESVRDHRRTAVPACHGPGKSFTAAQLTAWWLDVHPPGEAFVVTTAPTDKQVKAILWREIIKVHKRAQLAGYVTQQAEWKLGEELVAYGRKPADQDEDGFQGIHARWLLVILDEACGIPKQLWTAAGTLMTNEDARLLAIGNPDDPQSEFAEVCAGADPDQGGLSNRGYNVLPIPAAATPLFTGEPIPDTLRPMLVSPLWVEEHLREVGSTESPLYVSKVLARFPTDASDGVIAWSWIKKSQEPSGSQIFEPRELGIDVGGSETGDETVVYERIGMRAGRRWSVQSSDPEQVLQLIERAIVEANPSAVKIDAIGIGWGLAAGLRRTFPQLPVHGVVVSEAASKTEGKQRFKNLRAQIWWQVGRALSRDAAWDLSAVDHDRTLADLAAPKWSEDSSGRIVIESKDDIRKRIGRSPDNADALLLAFYVPGPVEQTGQAGYGTRSGLKGRR